MFKQPWTPAPNWKKVFQENPGLNPPGYDETVEQVRSREQYFQEEILRKKMREIHKEKSSYKSKVRQKSKKKGKES